MHFIHTCVCARVLSCAGNGRHQASAGSDVLCTAPGDGGHERCLRQDQPKILHSVFFMRNAHQADAWTETMHIYAHAPYRWNAHEEELISRGYILTILACDYTHRYSFGRAELPWQKKTTPIPGSVAGIRRATDRQVCLHPRSFTCVRASVECVVVPVSGAQTY